MILLKNCCVSRQYILFQGPTVLCGSGPPHYQGFIITLRHTRLGKTPLDEWSGRHRDRYATINSTHKRHTSMSPGGVRTSKSRKRAGADPRLRPHGHRDRPLSLLIWNNSTTRADGSRPGWPVPEAVITAVRAPSDGCQHPKHVELPTEV